MELRKFLPYDVLGAGLWSALFCLLGYLFWRSLSRVEAYIGRGAAAFTGLVVVGLAIWLAIRYRRDEEFRAKVRDRLDRSPVYRRVNGPLGFVAAHATLELELATLLSLAAVGVYVFFGLASLIGPGSLALDQDAFDMLDSLYTGTLGAIVRVVTNVGSLPVTSLAVILTAAWATRRGRGLEGAALVVAQLLTFIAVHVAKDAAARPRPPHPHSHTTGFAYPSGHSAYAVALVACAVVLARGGHRWATRFALVGVAIGLAVGVAASRVYLRAHYLSDVVGGLALGAAIYALVGVVALGIGVVRNTEGR
jgi:undecaprenyl-diphosphatase